MLTTAVRLLFGRIPQRPVATPGTTDHASLPDSIAQLIPEPLLPSVWPASRLALTNQLWGAGFIFPGGETETMRLARPLGVSSAASLLLIGVGAGGPASAITGNLGAWVTGMETDPSLLAAARGLISRGKLGKKVSIKEWDPEHPVFQSKSHHHCLALEPFHGSKPEPILDGFAKALKSGGHLSLMELTAETPLDPADPLVGRWSALERRDPATVLAPVAVSRMLGRVGFDVRIAEDISQRHMEQAIVGWRSIMRPLRDSKPSPQEAAQLVREAELWLLRRRLILDGRLRMTRWHAISRNRDHLPGAPSTNGLSTA